MSCDLEPQADLRIASTDYFQAMGRPLLQGRHFTEFDDPGSTPIMIINNTMARALFPGENPIGQRVLLYGRPREIVGIVGSVRHRGFKRRSAAGDDSPLPPVSRDRRIPAPAALHSSELIVVVLVATARKNLRKVMISNGRALLRLL